MSGLILVREPYYNEAGYERQRGTLEGSENSRNYNEMAVLKLVQEHIFEYCVCYCLWLELDNGLTLR